jgi:hypothetical protein
MVIRGLQVIGDATVLLGLELHFGAADSCAWLSHDDRSRWIELFDHRSARARAWSTPIGGVASVAGADGRDLGLPVALLLDLVNITGVAEAAINAVGLPEVLRHSSLLIAPLTEDKTDRTDKTGGSVGCVSFVICQRVVKSAQRRGLTG